MEPVVVSSDDNDPSDTVGRDAVLYPSPGERNEADRSSSRDVIGQSVRLASDGGLSPDGVEYGGVWVRGGVYLYGVHLRYALAGQRVCSAFDRQILLPYVDYQLCRHVDMSCRSQCLCTFDTIALGWVLRRWKWLMLDWISRQANDDNADCSTR